MRMKMVRDSKRIFGFRQGFDSAKSNGISLQLIFDYMK